MNPTTVRISIAGSFGFRDIGDEAMLTADLEFLERRLGIGSERVALFGEDPDYVSRYHDHPRSHCHRSADLVDVWREWTFAGGTGRERVKGLLKRRLGWLRRNRAARMAIRAARRSHVALITGGGTINTRDEAGWSLHRMHAIVRYFRSLGLKIFMSGQTIGPLGLIPEHDRLAREIVDAVDVLTVRDDGYSRHYLDLIGAKPKAFLETLDDAYSLSPAQDPLPDEIEEFLERGPVAAVNVTDYTAESHAQRSYVAAFIERIVRGADLSVALVGHSTSDFANLDEIHRQIPSDVRARVLFPDMREWTGSQSKQLVARCVAAVGGRYHFIVFAGTAGVPFVGMCANQYSYIKQHGFARPLGLGEWILGEEQTWNGEVLWATFERVLRERPVATSRWSGDSESMTLFGKWLQGS